jgi:hypothetical protein
MIRSIDGSTTWQHHNSGTTQRLTDVAFRDSHIGFAVGDGILQTSDDALSWSKMMRGVFVGVEEGLNLEVIPVNDLNLSNWPNPFHTPTTLTYTLFQTPLNKLSFHTIFFLSAGSFS